MPFITIDAHDDTTFSKVKIQLEIEFHQHYLAGMLSQDIEQILSAAKNEIVNNIHKLDLQIDSQKLYLTLVNFLHDMPCQ